MPPTSPAVIAHRGDSGAAPENTLLAVAQALDLGADGVEIDVRRTADGALVLLHDAGPRRTTDGARVFPARAADPVEAFTLAELRRLDAGDGERVPLFAEVLDLVSGRARLLVEVKDPARYPGVEHAVAAAVAPVDGVVVQSFEHAPMRAIAGSVPVGLLTEDRPSPAFLRGAAGFAAQVNPWHAAVDAAFVAAVHDLGMATSVWTVDGAADVRRLAAAGVDAVITDVPGAVRGLLRGPVSV